MEEIVRSLEKKRLKMHYLRWVGFITLSLGGTCLVYGWLAWYWGLAIMLMGLGLWVGGGQTKKSYVWRYKKELITELLREEFDDVVFEPEQGITKGEIMPIKLRDYGDKLYARNRFEGSYKGVPFVFSELRLVEVHQKDKDVKEKELFHGKWISFMMHKRFEGEVQVHRNPTVRYKNLEKIHFEDVAFNKKFRTFASNQHTAFHVVTPHLMEKIVKLGGEGEFDLCFENGRLHTAIKAYGDYFEAPILMKINLDRARRNLEEGVKEIKRYIEIMELYKKSYAG